MCFFQCIIIRVMLYRMRHRYLRSMRICFQSRHSIGESTVRNPSIRAGSVSTGPKGSTICIGTFCAGMLQDSVAEEDNSVKTIRKLQLILMPDQKPAGDNPKNGVKQHVKEYWNSVLRRKLIWTKIHCNRIENSNIFSRFVISIVFIYFIFCFWCHTFCLFVFFWFSVFVYFIFDVCRFCLYMYT